MLKSFFNSTAGNVPQPTLTEHGILNSKPNDEPAVPHPKISTKRVTQQLTIQSSQPIKTQTTKPTSPQAKNINKFHYIGNTLRYHTFNIVINDMKGPTVQIEHLTDVKSQDILVWKANIELVVSSNRWNDETALLNLKCITDPILHREFSSETTFQNALAKIMSSAFPRLDYRIYINKLSAIRRTKFNNLTEYVNEMNQLYCRANMCLTGNPNDGIVERELFEYFIRGLDSKEQEILINRGILDINEAVHELRRIEQTRIFVENNNNREYQPQKSRTSHEGKYCEYHENNHHYTKDCIVIKRMKQGNSKFPTKNKDKDRNSYTKKNHSLNNYMKSLRTKMMVSEITLNDEDTYAYIDTGATDNFVSTELVKLYKLTPLPMEKTTLELGNGEIIQVDKKVKVTITIKDIPTFKEEIEATILPGFTHTLNLGISFLNKHKILVDTGSKKLSIPQEANKAHFLTATDQELQKCLYEARKSNPEIGKFNQIKHEIRLIDENKNIISKEFRVPQALQERGKRIIAQLLEQNIIRKSNSRFCSPAFFVPKKNDSLRLVTDLRMVNSNTIKEVFPIPRIPDLLQDLGGSKYFSQVDFNQGFHQIEIREEDKAKTSFAILNNLYEYNRMPMGATNSPRTFQRVMQSLFSDLEYVKVYIDDLLIHSKTAEEHVEHVKEVLKRIKESGLSVNFEKSVFNTTQVKYLGCKVSEKGVEADLDAINKYEIITPKSKKDLQRILGFINYFRPFVKNLSEKLIEITEKTKDPKFQWTEKDNLTIRNIFSEIKTEGLLHHPNYQEAFDLHTDASESAIGSVLSQHGKPIRLYSKKLHSHELNYTVVEKECLGIVRSLENYRNIIYGQKIRIFTDNKNLTYIKNAERNRAQRWKIALEEYNYEIIHTPGSENTVADCLSRDIKTENKLHLISTKERITKIHNDLIHPGRNALYMTLKNILKAKNLKQTITEVTDSCLKCQREKDNRSNYGKISGTLYSTSPFITVSTDIMGPIPLVEFNGEGKGYVLSFIDCYSRYSTLYATKDIRAKTIANKLKEFLEMRPTVKRIISDQGTQYTSDVFKKTLAEKGIKHTQCSTYNPTANGIAERCFKTIGEKLRTMKGMNFRSSIRKIQTSINETYHNSIGTSPCLAANLQPQINYLNQSPTKDHAQILRRLEEKYLATRTRNNKSRIEWKFEINDKVMVKVVNPQKVDSRWEGPYQVVETENGNNAIGVDVNGVIKRVNIKRLKPFKGQVNEVARI